MSMQGGSGCEHARSHVGFAIDSLVFCLVFWFIFENFYDEILCAMGENVFTVEHAGVTARQRAGTLVRQVKYDQEAFKKA